jgi:hypothetical protein
MKKIIIDETGIQKEVDFTPEEIKEHEERKKIWEDGLFDKTLNKLRLVRNDLLLKSDWTDLPNAPLTDEKKIEWQSYRTELRDLTNELDTVEKIEIKMKVEDGKLINFPIKPS